MTSYHANERAQLKRRAKAVADAVAKEQQGDEPIFRSTRNGEVRMDSIKHTIDPDGIDCIEITAPDAPDPRFRIYNPPLLAEDPNGDVEIDGRRYSEDPVTALAQVLARHGAAKRKGRWLR